MRYLFLFTLLCAAARADVITTQRIITAVSSNQTVSTTPATLTLSSNDALLTESWGGSFGSEGAAYRRTLQLTRYAANQVVTLDTTLKIYKIEPIAPDLLPGMKTPKLRVTHLADETTLGYKTHHFWVDILFNESPFIDSPKAALMRQEIWLLPAARNPLMPTQARNLRGIEAADVSGDAQFWPEIQSGVWIKHTVYNLVAPTQTPKEIVYTEEVVSLSICQPLAPALFEVPGDYRQLSPAEFAAALEKEKLAGLERKMEAMDKAENAP